jgi:phosphatidylglycerophosphate synthase
VTFEEYLERWSALHGGYQPEASFWARGWLRLAYVAARPLRRVSPSLVTVLGILAAGFAVAAAGAGGRWALAAVALVLATALADSVDGAVAVLRDAATRAGFVLDSVADRLTDALFATAVLLLCAPSVSRGPVWFAALVPAYLLEYTRARMAAAGLVGIGAVTVWERPSRVIVTVATLVVAGADPARASQWAAVGVGTWIVLGVAALVHLGWVVRGALHGGDP